MDYLSVVSLILLLYLFTSAHVLDLRDGDEKYCTRTTTYTTTTTKTTSKCTKTITPLPSAVTVTVTVPPSGPPPSPPTCPPKFKIQFRHIGYSEFATVYDNQYAVLVPARSSASSPGDLEFAPTPSLSNATFFTLDASQGLIFANYAPSRNQPPVSVVGNVIRTADPAVVFFTPFSTVSDPNSGRSVLQCQTGPCDTQLRCFAQDNKRFFEVSVGKEEGGGAVSGREQVEMTSTPGAPREEGLFVVSLGCT